MQPFDSAADQPLLWTQPRKLERSYELRAGDSLVATLRIERPIIDRAIAESAASRWTLDRKGFFRRRAIITNADSNEEVGLYYYGFSGRGLLELASGRKLTWRATNFWQTRWEMVEQPTGRLFEIKMKRRWLKDEGEVELTPWGSEHPEIMLLLVTGWYLLLMHLRDSAVVAAAAAS